jgi:hypothetical protein
MEDVMANVLRSATIAASRKPQQSCDVRILLSVGIVVIGILVALFAITATPPINPSEIGNMSVFP